MLLYVIVGGVANVVDLSEDNPISLNYDLNNDRDLSAFTTTYSSELVLPLTRGNSVIFGHPSVGNVGGYYDYYILGDDGAKVDEGSLVVDYVDDDAVHCHLYGSVVSLNDAMSKAIGPDGKYLEESMTMAHLIDGDSMLDGSGISHPVNFYNPLTEDYDVANVEVKASNFLSYGGEGVVVSGDSYGDRGFLYFGITNIGIPKDFDSSHVYRYDDTLTTPNLVKDDLSREHTVLEMGQKAYETVSSLQYRPYQLQPYIFVDMLMQNIIHDAERKGFILSMSNAVHAMLSSRVYLTPKLDKTSNVDSITWNAPEVESSASGTILTRVGYSNGLSVRNVLTGLEFSDVYGNNHYRCAFHVLTLSNGTDSIDVLVCSGELLPDTAKKYLDKDLYDSIRETKPSYSKVHTGTTDLKTSLSSVDEVSYTVSYKTVVLDYGVTKIGSLEGLTINSVTTYNYASGLDGSPISGSDFNMIELNVADEPYVEISGDYPLFSYVDYFRSIDKPWDIVKKICKKFNIRLRPKSLKEWEFVLGSEYYDSVADISDIVDYTDSKTNAFVFPYKKILFADEPTDASWVKGYESLDSIPYGGKAYVNKEYPIESTKKWFEDPLKYTTSTSTRHGLYDEGTVLVDESPMLEACDKDAKEVDISGCVAYPDYQCNPRFIFITDDAHGVEDSDDSSQSYYLWDDLVNFIKIPQSVIGRKLIRYVCTINTGRSDGEYPLKKCFQLFNYGESRYNPSGVIKHEYLSEYFKDIIDSLKSSSFECGVFLNKYPNSIQKFIHTIHYFDNQYWVVGSISSYNPSSVDAARVRFIKVMDLDNYMTTEYFTISASSEDVSKGSVSPVSQSVRKGFDATVVATPATGYEFEGWYKSGNRIAGAGATYTFNVSGDVSLVAKFAVRKVTISASSVRGSISATYGGSPIVLPATLDIGSQVTVSLAVPSGYSFVKWVDRVSTSEYVVNPVTVTLSDDVNLVADTSILSYNLSVSCSPANSGLVQDAFTLQYLTLPYSTTLPYEEEYCYKAEPKSGFEFVKWVRNTVDQPEGQATIGPSSIVANTTLVAHFSSTSRFVISARSDDSSKGSVSPETQLAPGGGTASVTATPKSGYQFSYWTDNGVTVLGATATITLYDIDVNHTLVAYFSAVTPQYTVTASVSPAGSGTVSGGGTYPSGTDVHVVATAASGYQFSSWTVDGEPSSVTEAEYVFYDLYQNHTIVANFTPIVITYALSHPSQAAITSLTVLYASGEHSGEEYTLGTPVTSGTQLHVDVENTEFITDWYNSLTSTRLSVFPLSFTLVMNENITLQAVFTTTSNLTVITSTDGTVDVEFEDYPDYGTQIVDDVEDFLVPTGSNIILTATAISPATFDEWITDGSYYGSENPLTFEGGDYAEVEATYVAAPADNYLTFTKSAGTTTATANVYLRRTNTNPNVNCEYSLDNGATWTAMPQSTSASYTGYVSFTDTMLVRGTNASGFSKSTSQFARFVFGGSGSGVRVTVSGALTSLIDGHGYSSTTMPNDYCFYGLFMKGTDGGTTNDTRIAAASGLVFPSNVTTMCYTNMFYRATNLTNAGFALPVTKCGIGYDDTQSFSQNDCYARMFAYCTSLTTPPNVLCTDMGVGICAQMFMGCTALSNIPSWVSNVTKWGTYAGGEMFKGCTSLSSNIMLQADTCWQAMWFQMFHGCSAITNAIVDVLNIIPPTTGTTHMGGLAQMFMNCGNLNGVDVSTTGYVDGEGLTDWLSGVSTSGDIMVQDGTAASWAGLYPDGWTIHEV